MKVEPRYLHSITQSPAVQAAALLPGEDGQGYSKLDNDFDAKSLLCIIKSLNPQWLPLTHTGTRAPASGRVASGLGL